MGAAKEELRSAVDAIDEGQAELLLSFLHLLRSRRSRQGSSIGGAERRPEHASTFELLVLALMLERGQGSVGDLQRLLRQLSRPADLEWLALTEKSLSRDWHRPEEDEAWADL